MVGKNLKDYTKVKQTIKQLLLNDVGLECLLMFLIEHVDEVNVDNEDYLALLKDNLNKTLSDYKKRNEPVWSKKFEALKYYGGEMNEGGELFYKIADLAYHASGIGDNDEWIAMLYDFAKAWCEESKEYDDSEGKDFYQYKWGH